MTTYVFIITVLIVFSAYFSATETAFSSMNKTRMKAIAEEGNKKAVLACALADQYDKLLSTILIGNNIVNILASSLATVLFINLLENPDLGATVSTVVITLVVLIFGEITPKSVAKDMPERFAMFSAPFLNVLMTILTPLTFVFSVWKKLVSKFFKPSSDAHISQGELLMMVNEAHNEGGIDKDESDLLRNAIEFTERDAEDILTHRMELEALPADATREQIAAAFSESKFSRLLVYEGSIDNIVGVLHLKDFYTGSGVTDKPLSEIITPAVFVLKNEKISALLRTLQKAKSHIAVVLDEYGGTYGIVTMEDILEELVGDIWDEHDEVTPSIKRTGEHTYRVNCSMDLDEFCAFFHIKAESEMNSLCGWIADELGKIPEPGDAFAFGELGISVVSCESHRAELIDVTQQTAQLAEPDKRKE